MREYMLKCSTNEYHNPVMLKEVLGVIAPREGGVYMDATFGAGGYTKAILSSADCAVYAMDRDQMVERFAEVLSESYGPRFHFIKAEFGNLRKVVTEMCIPQLDGIVFDIGVSSMQLDDAARGFSFSKEAELDMRMDRSSGSTARDIVNNMPERELADIIFHLGGERKSRRIAHAICEARGSAEIRTTTELANIILHAVGSYNDSIHPATRTFQAIRIHVNDELGQLESALKAAALSVAVGGVIVVVTFHSLEDKIVKECFSMLCGRKSNTNRHMPDAALTCETSEANFVPILKGAVTPSFAEIDQNPRSRSAKCRAIRRVK